MSLIYVDGRTASVIERGSSILEAKDAGVTSERTRQVPVWLPTGDEVKTVAQVAVMMNVSEEVAAHYVIESKDAGEDLHVDALAHLQQVELKAVRHVRDAAYWKLPVGTVIIGGKGKDGTPLRNLTHIDSPYGKQASAVKGSDGRTYYVTKDPDQDGWIVGAADKNGEFDWGNLAVSHATNEEDAYKLLSQSIKAPEKHHLKSVKPLKGKHTSDWKSKLTDSQSNALEGLTRTQRNRYEKERSAGKTHTRAMDTVLTSGSVQSNPTTRAVAKQNRDAYDAKRRAEKDPRYISARAAAVKARQDDAKKAAAAAKPMAYEMVRMNAEKNGIKGMHQTHYHDVVDLKDRNKQSAYFRARKSGLTHAAAMKKVAPDQERGDQTAAAHKKERAAAKPASKPRLVTFGNIKVGDHVTTNESEPLVEVGHKPSKVVKVGPVTKTGRVTIYMEDGSQVTRKIGERAYVRDGSAPKA